MLWYTPSMFFRMGRKEGISSTLGIIGILGLLYVQHQGPALQPILAQTLLLLSIAVAVFGLLLGYVRHRDPSPLLFLFLGAGTILISSAVALPTFVPMLSGACCFVAGIWNALLSKHTKHSQIKPPTLTDFLDNTLLPPDSDAENPES